MMQNKVQRTHQTTLTKWILTVTFVNQCTNLSIREAFGEIRATVTKVSDHLNTHLWARSETDRARFLTKHQSTLLSSVTHVQCSVIRCTRIVFCWFRVHYCRDWHLQAVPITDRSDIRSICGIYCLVEHVSELHGASVRYRCASALGPTRNLMKEGGPPWDYPDTSNSDR